MFLELAGGAPGEWFINGNAVDGFDRVSNDNWVGVVNTSRALPLNAIRVDRPFSAAPVLTHSALDAYEAVLADAGASRPRGDAVDIRIVSEVTGGTGAIVDSPDEVGGFPALKSTPPPLDSDHDGMPDDWEIAHGLNPADPSDRNGFYEDGYTNRERFLNSLVPTFSSTDAHSEPASAFWPKPVDGAIDASDTPTLRWKAGFGTHTEWIYFGTTPELTRLDLRRKKPYTCSVAEKQLVTSSWFSPGKLQFGKTYYWRIDSLNESGLTTGPTWSFTPKLPVDGPTGDAERMEAERMTLDSAFIEENRTASGGKNVAVPAGTGSLRFAFAREPGVYRLVLRYLDESDGDGEISIFVNGQNVGRWVADANLDDYVTKSIDGIRLSTRDVIEITSNRQKDELGRIDYLETILVSPVVR